LFTRGKEENTYFVIFLVLNL